VNGSLPLEEMVHGWIVGRVRSRSDLKGEFWERRIKRSFMRIVSLLALESKS
jgi:hypothetical protein